MESENMKKRRETENQLHHERFKTGALSTVAFRNLAKRAFQQDPVHTTLELHDLGCQALASELKLEQQLGRT